MNKKTEGIVIIFALVGGLFFALRLPFLVYGGTPDIHADILLPRYTATPRPPEMAMTQQAFALLFFTPTSSAAPTDSFFAFLVPVTGNTQTLIPTVTKTNTVTALPTRTLIPVFKTQTKVDEGGGGGSVPGPSQTPTKAPVVTLTVPVSSQTPTKTQVVTLTVFTTSTQFTSSPNPTASNIVKPSATPTLEPTIVPVDTDTPQPTKTKKPTKEPPTDTPEPPPTATPVPPTDVPTDIPTDPPVPTDTTAPGGNSLPGDSSTSSPYFLQLIMMYLLSGTFLGVVFRRR